MQQDLGLTAEQAQRRLIGEARGAALERVLREQMGSGFSGAWMSEDGSQLIVGVTDDASAEQVRAAGAQPQRVNYTLQQLERMKTALDENAPRADKRIYSWHVDVMTNSVVVSADRAAQEEAERFVVGSGALGPSVRIIAANEAPRPMYDTRGGDAYYPGNARCSIGFAVNGGFVTAGHCGGVGTNTFANGVGQIAQGTVRGSTFPGNDFAWVQTNGSWVSRPWVNNYGGGTANVAGSNEAAVNSSVCRSGSTTGWHCGTIQARGVTVNYSQGAVYNLTQTNACCEAGDSGGSWLTGDQAQGVTSGGSGNCTSGGQTFFQPLNPILSNYGLSLTTSGGSTGGGGIASRLNNRCIDVPNSNFSDGVQLQMWDCNGTNAQQLVFYSDGTLRVGGKCVDVAWGSTASGAVIQIANCSGNPAQQFVMSGAGDLVNPQANKCVDIKDANANAGATLQIWDCSGAANQKWYFR